MHVFDLKKEQEILDAAYNDRAGVTAAFNLNLLERVNRELDGDLDIDRFEHLAFYSDAEGRVEIYARSLADQAARIAGKRQVVHGEQQAPDAQCPQRLEDNLAQRIYSRRGVSQIAPSGGSVTRAECGWLSHATSSAVTMAS